jgi:F-type H+-transporting ATPase subunit epsilon
MIGILEGHASLITGLEIGLLRVKMDNVWIPLVIFGGVAEIKENKVMIITNAIEDLANLKSSEATRELEIAVSVAEKAETSKDRINASSALKTAMVRLEGLNYVTESNKNKLKLKTEAEHKLEAEAEAENKLKTETETK